MTSGDPAAPVEPDPASGGRWDLIRDVLVFQLKLILDGLRDLILSPVSMVAGLIDVATGGDRRNGGAFYSLLRFGHRTDGWINLFGAAGVREGEEPPVVDDLIGRLESVLARDVEEGGLSAAAKASVDRALDRVQQHAAPSERTPDDRLPRRRRS